jgi:hypothetical protein
MASRFEYINNKRDRDLFGKTRDTIEGESGKRQSDRKLPDYVSREISEQITKPFKRIKCKDMIAWMTEVVLSQ